MPPSSRTKERVYAYLAEHGPSSSKEIERALDVSQPAISQILRGEADFRKVELDGALIYSWKQTRKGSKPPLIYTLADNVRSSIAMYRQLRAIPDDDIVAIRAFARKFIHVSVLITEHLTKLLEETDPEIYDEPAP